MSKLKNIFIHNKLLFSSNLQVGVEERLQLIAEGEYDFGELLQPALHEGVQPQQPGFHVDHAAPGYRCWGGDREIPHLGGKISLLKYNLINYKYIIYL